MHNIQEQKGSAHVIIIAVLAIALAGTLGVVFYQNFIAKKAIYTDNASKQASNEIIQATDSQSTIASTVGKKEYCTQLEKLCFSYPETWTASSKVDKTNNDLYGFSSEDAVIATASGTPYLYVTTGVSGIGGSCNPDEMPDMTILETHTTGIYGKQLQNDMPTQYMSTAYAVKYVQPTSRNAQTYVAGMFITAVKPAAQPGTVNACTIGYHMFTGKASAEAPGSTEFATTNLKTGVSEKTHGSYKEASDSLKTDDAETAYEILKTAHYN